MFIQRISGFSLCATLILAALTPSHAQFFGQRGYFTSNPIAPNGGVLWSSAEYVDFSSTSTNTGRTWATFMNNNTPTEKYSAFQILTPADGGFQCFEITTDKGYNGFQDVQTVNGDTRLFMRQKGPTTIFHPIHDDINGMSNRYSKMRVWAIPNLNMYFRAAAYSTNSNGIDFYLIVKSLKVANKAGCKLAGFPLVNTETTNASYPIE